MRRLLPAPGLVMLCASLQTFAADIRPDATMLQFPDIGKDTIVFVYANDLWEVPVSGGQARRLASPPGPEMFPRYSPDNKTIAYVGNYDGNRDLYTIAAEGAGVSQRVTHHPSGEMLCDWMPDGSSLIFYTNGLGGLARQVQLFTVGAKGGLPSKMPVPYGATGAVSADGEWLAYTPHTTDFRTWKRYRGGMATDIWLFNLKNNSAKKITDWEGTDTQPMWHPGRADRLYYVCDQGPEHRLNVWSYDVSSGERKQVTTFEEFDCKFASIGPGPKGTGTIVLQNGAGLFTLDCNDRTTKRVDVVIPGDRPTLRDQVVNFADFIVASSVSPTGKRIAVEARGDIWTLPAEKGATMNLTHSSNAAERDPIWSPDGKTIAYLSDETGEYELYVRNADGKGEARKLTTSGENGASAAMYRFMRAWSPDSKKICYTDKAGGFYVHTLGADGGAGTTDFIGSDRWAEPGPVSWAADSRWIALTLGEENTQYSLHLYNVEEKKLTRVTDPMFHAASPAFDRKGEWLYFVSARNFSPTYSDIDGTFIYDHANVLLAVALRKDVKSPYLAKNDSEEDKDAKKDEDKKKDDENKEEGDKDDNGEEKDDADKSDDADDKKDDAGLKDEKKEEKKVDPIAIDLEGFETRAIQLPPRAGNFGGLSVGDNGKLFYVRDGEPDRANPRPRGQLTMFDITDDKKEEKTVASGIDGYEMSADGKKLLVWKSGDMYVVDAGADQKLEKKAPKDAMTMSVNPREEWKQMFTEAWRLQRDYFYEATLHGVDWNAMKKRYGDMVEDCVTRDDLTFVIAELISELNVGHAYYRIPGFEKEPSVNVGLLGCDYELVNGAYRIKKIHSGGAWDSDARGPLSQPGVDVKVGDYLLAVNGRPIDTSKDPWAAFQGLADKTTIITVSENPTIDDKARDVLAICLSSEGNLRYRGWIEEKRQYVSEKSGGKIGYAYVPNTGVDGQNDLFRQFYGQRTLPGFIVDERWNGGGQIPNRFIELLSRPRTNYWAKRDGSDWAWPPDSSQAVKAMLANGLAGSGGDMFPWLFKHHKVGPVFGTRTWGGLVGISGNPDLIDGTHMTVPTFGFYNLDGTWGIEGHGVDPDFEVIDDPSKMVDGGDPQLDAAIEWVLAEIQRNPPVMNPPRPKSPNRSGMGITEEDK